MVHSVIAAVTAPATAGKRPPPSRQVSFDPEAGAVESILIKYEWRATLCRMNVIPCGTTYGHTNNRLWDDHGYATPTPVRP